MDIHLHDTLTGEKKLFEPLTAGQVSMYNCGPTVYNYAHIGNFRTSILNDLLRRAFEYNNFSVTQVMNITDIDDKTIRKSQEEGVSLETVTRKYEEIYFNDLASLNIKKPTQTPRATDHIADMIALIQTLLDKGIAYTSTDGVYFDITQSNQYGALAQLDKHKTLKARIASDEYDKENAQDFSLWKFHTAEDGDVGYDAPFGKGRPGWHIECSAMAIDALGETVDIHTGATDLIFPHHTNEIAQSEAATGKQFVRYWVHGGFITVDGKKMSKSLGNIFTLADIRARGINPLAYRYFVLGAHYRSQLNFTWEALAGAETAWKKLRAKVHEVGSYTETEDENLLAEFRASFLEYINDDLNTPKAVALLWDIARDDRLSLAARRTLMLDFDRVLGLELDKIETVEIPAEVQTLITARDAARAEKNFAESDRLRAEIESHGFVVKDTQSGTVVTKD